MIDPTYEMTQTSFNLLSSCT